MKFKVKFIGSNTDQTAETFLLIVREENKDVMFKLMNENVEVWLTEEQYSVIKGSAAFVVTDIDNELDVVSSAISEFVVNGTTYIAPNVTVTHNLNSLAYEVVLTDSENYEITAKGKDSFQVKRLYNTAEDAAKNTVGYVILK